MQDGRPQWHPGCLVGTSSVDARHHKELNNDILRPAIPRHPASPVGLLASAPDLVPGRKAIAHSLRNGLLPTWISWGRDIDVNRCDPSGSSAPPSDFGSPFPTICDKQSTSTLPLAQQIANAVTYEQCPKSYFIFGWAASLYFSSIEDPIQTIERQDPPNGNRSIIVEAIRYCGIREIHK